MSSNKPQFTYSSILYILYDFPQPSLESELFTSFTDATTQIQVYLHFQWSDTNSSLSV